MKKLLLPLSLSLLAFSVLPQSGVAAEHEHVRRAVIAGRYKPLAEILAVVQKKYEGRVLDVELERGVDGRHVYEVKLLGAKGQRQEILIDAVTGQEVEQKVEPSYLPLSATLRKLLEVHPGRVIDADLKRDTHQEGVYQVRVLQDDGEIRSFFVEAVSGKLITDIEHVQPAAAMMALPDLLDLLQKTYPGTVIEAELKYDGKQRPFYEIDFLMKDGRLTEVWVDPLSGRVLSEDDMEIR